MMPNAILRVDDARFMRDGRELVAPFSLALEAGESATLEQPNERAAKIAARMVAGIVKPTTGRIYIADFETRLQPAQAKRLVGFVPADGFAGDGWVFRRELRFRAAVWGTDERALHDAAQFALAAFEDLGSYARALALALATAPALVVLEPVPFEIIARLSSVYPAVAIVCVQTPRARRPLAIDLKALKYTVR